jgi:hypothetical protein
MKAHLTNKHQKSWIALTLIVLLSMGLSACQTAVAEIPTETSQVALPTQMEPAITEETPSAAVTPSADPTSEENPVAQATPLDRNPDDWKDWPVFPAGVSDELKELYLWGIENGNDPHAFSIMGDCHSLPEVFLGRYDNDPEAAQNLDESLQETVQQFQGSFDRYSPTVVVGTTEGALLWAQWNENKEGYCLANELPIDCEIRYHRPSIAFIRVGTHWEARNEDYLRTIIEKLMTNGTVPVIVTKPDNRELDERVNHNLAKLAVEYDLPLWNFWASIQDLPNGGLSADSDMYLSDEAYAVQQVDGLEVLDFIYRSLDQ